MAFLDTLRQTNRVLGTPAGGTYGNEMYYGQPPIRNTGGYSGGDIDFEHLMNLSRNRDLHDFAARTRIAGDESIRQEAIRNRFDPNSGWMTTLRPPNTIYQPSLAEQQQIGPLDRAKLDLASKEIEATGGRQVAELGLKGKEYELDKLKNEQIYGTKQADMERKTEEANKRLQLAYDQLQAKQGDASAMAEYHKAQVDATNARMELQQRQHEAALTETKRLHDAQIKDMQAKMDALKSDRTSEDVWTDANGIQHKVVQSNKGSVPIKKSDREGYVRVIDPNGRHGDWNASKPLPPGYKHIGAE